MHLKRYLPFLIITAVALATFASGALLYRAKIAGITPTVTDASGKSAGTAGASGPHIRGNAKAQVTLEEFGDFQCPPCQTLFFSLTKIEHDYGDKLRVIFRQYPLAMHIHAMRAAEAAEAAGMQGKFWEMHDMLYQTQPAWSKAADARPLFAEYAETLALDVPRFKADLASPALRERIAAEQQRATSLGVKSTPTVFINNHLVPPASLDEQSLRGAIDRAIRGENPIPTTPTPSPSPSPVIPPS